MPQPVVIRIESYKRDDNGDGIYAQASEKNNEKTAIVNPISLTQQSINVLRTHGTSYLQSLLLVRVRLTFTKVPLQKTKSSWYQMPEYIQLKGEKRKYTRGGAKDALLIYTVALTVNDSSAACRRQFSSLKRSGSSSIRPDKCLREANWAMTDQ